MSVETADRIFEWVLVVGFFGAVAALKLTSMMRRYRGVGRALRPYGNRAHHASLAALAVGMTLFAGGLLLLVSGFYGGKLHGLALAAGVPVTLGASFAVGLTSEGRRAAERRRRRKRR